MKKIEKLVQPENLENISTCNYVVAIGASAGGLEAIHEFFDNLTCDTGLSFVVIQHLSTDYKSLLVELVSKHTHMKVYEAEDGMLIQKDCVYVIPNNKLIIIKGAILKLLDKPPEKAPNTAIDFFLYSLAEEKGAESIAIILSGTGTDGTKGIARIKQLGGIVIVQDPVTAKFDGMPKSAIASDNIDYILPPELMAAEICELVNITPKDSREKLPIDESQLALLFALIHRCTGWDFNFYKRPTIFRRIKRRMNSGGFKTFDEYIDYLDQNSDECEELSKDFLIGVTKFFRDKPAFDILSKIVFPEIVKGKENGDFIKVWITACSTGEEAYSIAILLNEYLSAINKIVNVKIFATDIDTRAIEIAGKGVYDLGIESEIEHNLLSRYFVREGNKYIVAPYIRKQIVFAVHNIVKDPPFVKNDLVSCRNMLIYMESSLQKKIQTSFHFSLNNGGYLFLGTSETLGYLKQEMEEVDSRWKIYRKLESKKSSDFTYTPISEDKKRDEANKKIPVKSNRTVTKLLSDTFNEVVGEDFGFAGVYIDSDHEIKEAIGNFRKYLSLPDKVVNLNLFKMVPKDAFALLSMGLRRAIKQSETVRVKNIKLTENGVKRLVDVVIKPPLDNTGYILLVFGETILSAEQVSDLKMGQNDQNYESFVVSELEAELKETRISLRAAIEELESTNEKLQSSNEELLSANEELQSSNEELQSLNEELHTLNTEHQLKIRELIDLNNDLDNYFRTTDIGQVFLDEKLCIRKFSSAAVRIINLIESDIGRPIDNISTNIKHENLLPDIQAVLKTGQMVEKEIALSTGASCLLRINPYLQQDKRQKGVVITFVDITALKDLDNIIKGIFNSNVSAIVAYKSVRNVSQEIIDFRCIAANYAAEELLKNNNFTQDKLFKKHFPEINTNHYFQKLVSVVENDKPYYTEYELLHDGLEVFYDMVAVKMLDGLVITFTNVTEKKEAENKLRRNFRELNTTKEKLRKLNDQLEAIVKERTRELTESEERFRLVSMATNDAIWDWNLSNNHVWWSDSFSKMLGYSNYDNTINFWFSIIHPDDLQIVKESIYNVINTSGDSWVADYRILRADGGFADVLNRSFLLKDEYGSPYRMVGSLMDVTSLRDAERAAEYNLEQRKFLAESVPLIVWTASTDGKINFINKQFTAYTGLPLEVGIGTGWKTVVYPEDIQPLEKCFKQAVLKKLDFAFELRVKSFDATYRWNQLRARAQKDNDGKLVMWLGTLTEIHEQKLANKILEEKVAERTSELQNAVAELEISNNNLQQFAYIASHDLKEPLRKIHMFSSEVKNRFLTDAGKTANDYIDKVVMSSIRLTKLINDLLAFSTISSNSFFQSTNLQKQLEEVLSDLELIITEKQAIINVAPLPVIEAIPSQIRQVFQNLINNALKFSRQDVKPVINITCEKIAAKDFNAETVDSGTYIRIKVIDNGIGFSEQYIDKIFMIFQRLHSKNTFEGTGIGLAITKSIIEKHRGLITAKSRENEGSTFIIVLPLQQGDHKLKHD